MENINPFDPPTLRHPRPDASPEMRAHWLRVGFRKYLKARGLGWKRAFPVESENARSVAPENPSAYLLFVEWIENVPGVREMLAEIA